jgi:hypothetical protein
MKAIFSFWSKCFKESSDRRVAGFYNEHFFITSFKLAIACARKSFDTVELYTDKAGYKMLVSESGLIFDDIHVVLDDINDLPSDLWMSGKLYTYSFQKEPFIHLDYDLYLLKPLPHSFQNMPVVVQCEELFIHTDIYSWGINLINSTHKNIPLTFSHSKNVPYHEQKAYNMGLVGGQNYKDIAQFGTESLQLIKDNLDEIKALPNDKQNLLNIVYEQYFFTQYMLHNNIPVTIYMPDALKRYKFDNDTFVHLLSKVKAYHGPCVEMEEVYLSKYRGV